MPRTKIPFPVLLVLLFLLPVPPVGADQPATPDAWTEYPDAAAAEADGWVRECGLSQAICVDADCAVGGASVGCRATQATWCNEFGLEKSVPLGGTTSLVFQHKASWPNLNFQVRLYMQPTAAEAAQGVEVKRLAWSMPTQTTWTQNIYAIADGEWSWRVSGMWQPSGYEETLTEMVGIKWFFCTYFGIAIGDRLLIDGLMLEQDASAVPPSAGARLENPWPNPFNPSTEMRIVLPEPTAGRLVVYDLCGKRVRVLEQGLLGAGTRCMRWDGRDDRGGVLPAGEYFLALEAGGARQVRKVLLLK